MHKKQLESIANCFAGWNSLPEKVRDAHLFLNAESAQRSFRQDSFGCEDITKEETAKEDG